MDEVHWVLDQGRGQTLLVRRTPAEAGAWMYLIRQGRVVTLPQMVFLGHKICPCYDIYKTYTDLPVFIHKKYHSGTQQLHKHARKE